MPAIISNNFLNQQQQQSMKSPTPSESFEINVVEDHSPTSLEVHQMMMIFADNQEETENNNEPISNNAVFVQEISAAPFVAGPNAFVLQVQLSNTQNELYKTQNLLDRANDHLRSVQAHNETLEAENAVLKAENASLIANVEQKCGERLQIEKQATAKAQRELEVALYRLKNQQETAEAFDATVAQRLQALVDDHIKIELKKKTEELEAKYQQKMNDFEKQYFRAEEGKNAEKKEEQPTATTTLQQPSSLTRVAVTLPPAPAQVATAVETTKIDSPSCFAGFFNFFSKKIAAVTSSVSSSPAASATSSDNKKNTSVIVPRDLSMTIQEQIEVELANIKRQILFNSSAVRKMQILDRIFVLASQYAEDSINAVFVQGNPYYNAAYSNNIYYTGYQRLGLSRNPCLFSIDHDNLMNDKNNKSHLHAASLAPVAKSFFKVVDEVHFMNAIDPVTGELDQTHFEFSFHGTRGGPIAANNIQCEGFMPQKRSSMAMGVGDYSAFSTYDKTTGKIQSSGFATALGYSQNCILVNLVYKPDKEDMRHKQINKIGGYSAGAEFFGPVARWEGGLFVIDNPLDRAEGTYMLPLGVIYNMDNLHLSQQTPQLKRTCSCVLPAVAHASDAFNFHFKKLFQQQKPVPKEDDSTLFNGKRLHYKKLVLNSTRNGCDPILETIELAASFHLLTYHFNRNSSTNENNKNNAFATIADYLLPTVFSTGEVFIADMRTMKMNNLQTGEVFELVVY